LSAAPAISEPSADSEVALELALWESVKDGSPAEPEANLEQYPNGTFASLARTRLEAGTLSFASADTSTPAEAATDALDLAFWNSLKDTYRREELEAYLAETQTATSRNSPARGSRRRKRTNLVRASLTAKNASCADARTKRIASTEPWCSAAVMYAHLHGPWPHSFQKPLQHVTFAWNDGTPPPDAIWH
jgi:hypothetical protein